VWIQADKQSNEKRGRQLEVSDHENNGRDQSIRAPAPASSAVGPTRLAPPRRRSPHRAQTKQTCGWWRDTLVMDAIDTNPANAAGRVQPLCVPCAGAPLQTAPSNAAVARRRPAATCMQFTCAHYQLRPRAPASFLYAPHEILQAARQACCGKISDVKRSHESRKQERAT